MAVDDYDVHNPNRVGSHETRDLSIVQRVLARWYRPLILNPVSKGIILVLGLGKAK